MVTHPISLLTYLPAVGAQVTHMCSRATGFAPERTGAAPGTHLILFHYKSVKRRSHHQRCCGCKQSFRSPPPPPTVKQQPANYQQQDFYW